MDINQISECLKNELEDIELVYQFGSQTAAQSHKNSDLDLAVKCKKPITIERIWQRSGQLADLAGCDVDLIDLSNAPTVMRIQIVANGERLYANNKNEAAIFEAFVYSDYARLNEERAEILKDISSRGTVYG